MRTLHLLAVHLRLSLLNELQYRANLVAQVFQSVLGLFGSLLGLGIVFSKTDSLGGWGPNELLIVVGVYFLVGGLTRVVLQPSLEQFMSEVREGTLDFTLTKPVDAQVLVAMRRIQVWKIVDVIIGVIVIAVGMVRLGGQIGVAEAALFVLALLAGVSIVFSFLFLLATTIFWFVKLDNLFAIFQSMYEAGRWPITIYPGWLQVGLTLIVPIGFAITVPASGLTNRATPVLLFGALVLAVVLPLIARWFWKIGLSRYAGASA